MAGLDASPRARQEEESLSASSSGSPALMRVRSRCYFGKTFSIFEVEGEKYLLGVQMASMLRRETYNVYGSLKIKKISMQRASSAELSFLTSAGAVHLGTHSVTLVPHDDAINFLADALQLFHGFKADDGDQPARRPILNRRKRFPWEIKRSLPNERRFKADGADSPKAEGTLWSPSLGSFFNSISESRRDHESKNGDESEEILISRSVLLTQSST